MAAAFGASIVRAPTLVHGEASEVTHDGAGLLEGMPPSFMAARYHSLAIDPATLPPELRVTAMSEVDRVIMGIRHVSLPLEGVQFHPESVLTPQGPHLLANFLRQAGEGEASRLDDATGLVRDGRAWPRRRAVPMSDLVRAALDTIVDGGTLSMDEARGAMGAVMDGEATPAQLAALLMGLRMRGETVDELAGFATAMRERVVRVEAPDGAIDVVGTGGDGSGTFNISTTAALVAAAAGVPVAKHGNRAMTSRSGSADVLDALGVRIDHDAASAGAALREHRLRVPVRPELPPGDAPRRPDPARDRRPDRVQPARAADQPGRDAPPAPRRRRRGGRGRGWPRSSTGSAPSGRSSSTATASTSCRSTAAACSTIVRRRRRSSGTSIDAAALGLQARGDVASSPAGRPTENARMTEAVLRGEPGIRRDVVLLNAGAALLVAGVVGQMEEGIERAALTIDAGLGARAARAPARRAARGRGRAAAGVTVADRRDRAADGRRARRGPNVVAEIAARRRADIRAELAAAGPRAIDRRDLRRARRRGRSSTASRRRGCTSSPRSSARRRRPAGSPPPATTSSRAPAPTRPAARRRSRSCASRTGSAARSTTCARSGPRSPSRSSPRSSSSTSVQLPILRAAGADLVLLLAVLHPPRRLARLVERALDARARAARRGPRRARARARRSRPSARLIGLNNRDLRTLDVDLERAVAAPRARPGRPARHRRVGRPRARDGRPLARARVRRRARRRGARARAPTRPPRLGRSWRPAPRPHDPANVARRPFVKICGVTDVDGVLAAVARRRRCDRAQPRPGHAARARARRGRRTLAAHRPRGRAGRRPPPAHRRRSPPTPSRRRSRPIVAALDPDVVQLPGDEPSPGRAAVGRRTWKVLHVPPAEPPTPPRPRRDRRRRAAAALPRRRGRPDPPRHGRRPHPGRDRDARRRAAWPPRSPASCRSSSPAA